MTEPSQYFKGRTVQEQMNEVIGYVDVRSAEVATDAIAADVAQVHQDMLDADADATAAAASAAAAAGTLANAVKKTGEASQSIAGDIAVAGTLSGGVVTGTQVTVPTPVNNTDAATKKYVDDQDTSLKTYVDTQDATKISITDINSCAVGLTGNQTDILGDKTFKGVVDSLNNFVCPALKWSLLYTRTNANYIQWLVGFSASSMFIASVGSSRINVKVLNGVAGRTYPQPVIKVCKKADGTEDVWMNADYGAWVGFDIIKNWIGYTTTNKYAGVSYTSQITSQDNAPVVGDTYISVVDSVDFNNEH